MKPLIQIGTSIARCVSLLALTLALGLVSGCGTPAPRFPDDGTAAAEQSRGPQEVFRIGDLVTIDYAGPGIEKKPHEERVKEDGTITPPDIGSIKAAGRTPGELQRDLQKEYDRLYRNMTVTVKSELRYYYVEGEVRMPGPKTYLGETDIVKAISSASGFTEFARKGRIQLRRPNRPTEFIDYQDAINDARRNPPVYPGDTIYVPRRFL